VNEGPSGNCCKSPQPVAEHNFKTVNSETVYIGNIFALRADDVRMPGGNTARREVVEHYGAVAIVAMDDDKNIALVYQYRHPVGRRLWELPAGLLDLGGEAPHLTAARELEEEAGLARARETDYSSLTYLAGKVLNALLLDHVDYDERAGWLAVRRGEHTMLANFARNPVHVPREHTEEVVLATHAPTLEPGFVVLPALSGALVR